MIKNIFHLDNFLKSSTVAGLEVLFLSDGQKIANVCIVKKTKSAVNIDDSQIAVNPFQSFPKNRDFTLFSNQSSIPCCLVLNGKGILHKKISFHETDDDKTLLQKVLPNANPEEFYFQKSKANHSSLFISVVRKPLVDELLEELKKNNIEVISCSLGVFSVVPTVFPLINNIQNTSELTIENHHFTLGENNSIADYRLVEKTESTNPIQVGNNFIEQKLFIPFAAALQYFIGNNEQIAEAVPQVTATAQEFKQKKIFQSAGWAGLIFFLSILLVNYFSFDHYWKKKNGLGTTVSLYQDALLRNEQLKNTLTEKQSFLEKAGLLEVSRTSFYADQLAQDIPSAIQLTELTINPLVKKNHEEENEVAFTSKVLTVAGVCKASTALNEWLKIIQKKTWVKEVTLLNYSQDKTKEVGEFSVEVKIK